MTQIGVFEAKNKLSALLGKVEAGEEVTITRHGKPVARIVAIDEGLERAKRREAMQKILELRKSISPNAMKGTSFKELIEEGRR